MDERAVSEDGNQGEGRRKGGETNGERRQTGVHGAPLQLSTSVKPQVAKAREVGAEASSHFVWESHQKQRGAGSVALRGFRAL